jgi:hypothetical protein
MDWGGSRARCPGGSVPPVILTLAILFCTAGLTRVAFAGDEPEGESIPFSVCVDIRPGLCPNHLRLESSLTVPIAILGTMDFEIAQVDPATVRLSRDGTDGEVEPVGWAYADVGTPVIGGLCACHKLRGDGLDDLKFEFSIEDVAAMLGLDQHSGERIHVTLSGNLMTGESIEGADCVHVISGLWADEDLGDEIGMLSYTGEETAAGPFEFAYYTTVTDRVTFAIYDMQGRVVARLVDMDMAPGIYKATWDGATENRRKAQAGIYFARLNNSWASDTRKITVQP